jgi:hypothetical protein
MASPDWHWDDSSIPDSDIFLRRVSAALFEDAKVIDYEGDSPQPGAGMFRYDGSAAAPQYEGLSCHSLRILEERGRTADDAYRMTPGAYAAMFTAGMARTDNQAGVHLVPDDEEPDPDLAAAHALVRTPEPLQSKRHPLWNQARAAILESAWWHHEHPERALTA